VQKEIFVIKYTRRYITQSSGRFLCPPGNYNGRLIENHMWPIEWH